MYIAVLGRGAPGAGGRWGVLYILQLSNVSQPDYICGSVVTLDVPRSPTYNCKIWKNNLLQLAIQFSLNFPKYASYL
jgi:hypothetical protein